MSPPRRILPLVVAGALCAGGATAATGPTLHVSPTTVHRGDHVAISGKHWGSHKLVTLLVGRPHSTATALIDKVATTATGEFSGTVPVKRSAAAGKYYVIACRKSCAIKVRKAITILP